MADSREIVGWFYRNGKRIPIRKGKGHAKTKSGWGKPEKEYSGASDDYQYLYKGGRKIGSVVGYDNDGDYGYNARDKDKKHIGNYRSREKAQKAVEKNNSKLLAEAKRERELKLTRELGELRDQYSLLDDSEENKARAKRIKEILNELDLHSKPRANRRPPRLRWK